jgi:hypothetical protein
MWNAGVSVTLKRENIGFYPLKAFAFKPPVAAD